MLAGMEHSTRKCVQINWIGWLAGDGCASAAARTARGRVRLNTPTFPGGRSLT